MLSKLRTQMGHHQAVPVIESRSEYKNGVHSRYSVAANESLIVVREKLPKVLENVFAGMLQQWLPRTK